MRACRRAVGREARAGQRRAERLALSRVRLTFIGTGSAVLTLSRSSVSGLARAEPLCAFVWTLAGMHGVPVSICTDFLAFWGNGDRCRTSPERRGARSCVGKEAVRQTPFVQGEEAFSRAPVSFEGEEAGSLRLLHGVADGKKLPALRLA